RGRAIASTRTIKRNIWRAPFARVMAASEFLGPEEGHAQIDDEKKRKDRAKHQIQHRRLTPARKTRAPERQGRTMQGRVKPAKRPKLPPKISVTDTLGVEGIRFRCGCPADP